MSRPRNPSPKDAALRLLTQRDRSCQELRIRLERVGFGPEQIEETIEWLLSLGYLDDRRFAKNWVEQRNRFRPTGNYGLQAELRSRGVADQIISDVLNSPDKELQVAEEAAAKKQKTLSRLPREKQLYRLLSFLERRGFPFEVSREVVNRLLPHSLDTDF